MKEVYRARAMRTCVGCGERAPQSQLVRIQYRDASGLEVVEKAVRGRSAYLHRDATCRQGILKSKLLRRSLRTDVDRAVRLALLEWMDHNRSEQEGVRGA